MSPADGHDHESGHHHHHHHDIELVGGWQAWRTHPVLRVMLGSVAMCAFLTLAGVAVLWPGDGLEDATAQAAEFGFGSDRLAATVETVLDGPCSYQGDAIEVNCRSVTVRMEDGPDAGSLVVLPEFDLAQVGIGNTVEVGDALVIGYEPSNEFYFFADRDRRASLGWLTLAFAVVVLALGRVRGLSALAAMALTLLVLIGFVAPSVLDGNDPLLVCLVGASLIAFVSLYLTHGVSPTTTVALAGTLASLVLTLGIASVVFRAAQFSGLASDEGLTLPIIAGNVDLVGLLLGGAMIGALGALDDVTVSQVATVAELKRRRPDLTVGELVVSGIRVGREHIASTVNTLLLAYAGASMPLLLLFAVSDQPLGMVANSETVAIEIARTLSGSIGLVAATPLTTVLAAVVVAWRQPDDSTDGELVAAPDESSAPGGSDRLATPAPAAAPEPEPKLTWEDFGPRNDPDF